MFPLYVPFDKSDNFFGLFRHVYVFARIFGFVSFSVNFTNVPLPSKVQISLFNRILLLLQISVHVLCLTMTITVHGRNTAQASTLVLHGLAIVNQLAIFCGLLFVLVDVVNSQKLWKIFKTFIQFDREIMYILSSYSIDYKNAKKSVKRYMIIWITITVLISIYSVVAYANFHRLIITLVSYVVLLMVSCIYVNVLSLYSFLLYNAKIRFNVLNRSLRSSFSANRKITEIEAMRASTCDTIMKMAKLHGQLNDIIDDTNGCYSVQVMLCFAGIFSYLVFVIYSLYRIWFVTDDVFGDRQFLMTSIFACWSIFFAWLGLFVVFLGSSTRSEAKKTGVIVHECINVTHNHIIVERLLAFSQQLLHRSPDANCKLFSFDWTLVFSANMKLYLWFRNEQKYSEMITKSLINNKLTATLKASLKLW